MPASSVVAPSSGASAPSATDGLVVEILTIGDELCRGEIIDTNSSWLAEQLTELGCHVRYRSSVTDDASDMLDALRRAAGRARLVVCSGGLGPTEDDRTVDVAAELAGVAPRIEAEHEARMRDRFAKRNFRLTENNLRQVRIPEGAEVLPNYHGVDEQGTPRPHGLAPGFVISVGQSQLAFMPGVPREMKPMFEAHLAPRVRSLTGAVAHQARRVWRVGGVGESHVDHALRGLLDGVDGATLHFRLAFPETLVTVVARRGTLDEARAVVDRLDEEVRRRLGDHCYGSDEVTLAARVGELLLARAATLAVAESCTGGLLGELVTATSGSSRYFVGGVIAYANALKESLLDVPTATIVEHGAVSEPVVLAMAEGARRRTGATHALAISGVAGPTGGSADKPVGTVFVALAGPSGAQAKKIYWPGSRDQVRQIGAFAALQLLYKELVRAPSV